MILPVIFLFTQKAFALSCAVGFKPEGLERCVRDPDNPAPFFSLSSDTVGAIAIFVFIIIILVVAVAVGRRLGR